MNPHAEDYFDKSGTASNEDHMRRFCLDLVQRDIAIVTLEFASPDVIVIKKDVRMTLAQKIGACGK